MTIQVTPINPPDKESLLGVGISPVDLPQAIDQVQGWVVARQSHYVCVAPAHSIMDGYRSRSLRRVFNRSGLTTPDGMSVVWLLRLLGHRQVSRVYGPDLMLAVCARSVRFGWKNFFYGGAPGVAASLAVRLQGQFPGLCVAGVVSPPYNPLTAAEDQALVAQVNASAADLVWVGLSSPRQDFWMADHLGQFTAPVMLGVGAAFDFLSGRKPQAPHWMQRSGLEWLFRFASEPRRLWPRYRQYPLFVALAAQQLLGLRHFPLED
ncbi:MAG: WecB/TagA/CpsF family glycosyltransferase [Anaerolineaceae bacterium]|nr:WecB/TagA/CpsF family glycosyltransferase [Anaerolineaceae bacterium]